MALLSFDSVFQNLLTLGILLGVFYFVYKSMNETKTKAAIRSGFEKIKFKKDE